LNGSSLITRPITTSTAVTPGWPEPRRRNAVAYPHSQSLNFSHIPGGNIATAYFRPQLPPELEFDTDAFTEQRSVLFKRLHVSRFWDAPHKSFVYVVWTDRLINGSPQNSISAVVAQPWGNQAPDLSLIGSAAAAPPQ
jgi:hypothetical protein